MLRTRFAGVYDGVHVLPFFTPFDGADAGFDPIDHTKVDPRLGSWDDVAELSKSHDIIVDATVNHMSWESAQFQDVLKNGEKSEYYPMFLTMSSVFPNGPPKKTSPASTARAANLASPALPKVSRDVAGISAVPRRRVICERYDSCIPVTRAHKRREVNRYHDR